MRSVLLIGLLLVAGCSSEVEKATARFDTAERAKDNAAMCREGKKVADAYLSAQDAAKYRQWSTTADVYCLTAELNGR